MLLLLFKDVFKGVEWKSSSLKLRRILSKCELDERVLSDVRDIGVVGVVRRELVGWVIVKREVFGWELEPDASFELFKLLRSLLQFILFVTGVRDLRMNLTSSKEMRKKKIN